MIQINNGVKCSVAKRPGLGAFFNWIRERRKAGLIEGPWLFGHGASSYVEAVLSKLDPKRDIFGTRVLTKEHCTKMQTPWPWVLKELATIPVGSDENSEGTSGDMFP